MASRKDDKQSLEYRDSEARGKELFRKGYYHKAEGGGYTIGKPRRKSKSRKARR